MEAVVHYPKFLRREEGNSSTITNASSFTHTVQLVSHHKDDDELAHIKDHIHVKHKRPLSRSSQRF